MSSIILTEQLPSEKMNEDLCKRMILAAGLNAVSALRAGLIPISELVKTNESLIKK